jgi:hypothetical protein
MIVPNPSRNWCVCSFVPEPQTYQQQTGFWEFVTKAGALLALIATVRSLIR